MMRRLIYTGIACLALALPTTAFAQGGSPTELGYGGEGTQVLPTTQAGGPSGSPSNGPEERESQGSPSSPVAKVSRGGKELPFTGYDAGVLALLAAGLLASGFGLRLVTQRQ